MTCTTAPPMLLPCFPIFAAVLSMPAPARHVYAILSNAVFSSCVQQLVYQTQKTGGIVDVPSMESIKR